MSDAENDSSSTNPVVHFCEDFTSSQLFDFLDSDIPLIATVGSSPKIGIFRLDTGEHLFDISTGCLGRKLQRCVFGQTPALAICRSDEGGEILLFDVRLRSQIASIPSAIAEDGVWSILPLSSSRRQHEADGPCFLAVGSTNGPIRLHVLNEDFSDDASTVLKGHTGCVKMMAVNEERISFLTSTLCSASQDSTLRIWDVAKETELNVARHPRELFYCQAWSTYVVTSCYDHKLRTVDLRTPSYGAEQTVRAAQTYGPYNDCSNAIVMKVHPERGDYMYVGHDDGALSLFDVRQGVRQHSGTNQFHSTSVRAIEYVGDGLFVSCDSDGVVSVWDECLNKKKEKCRWVIDGGHHECSDLKVLMGMKSGPSRNLVGRSHEEARTFVQRVYESRIPNEVMVHQEMLVGAEFVEDSSDESEGFDQRRDPDERDSSSESESESDSSSEDDPVGPEKFVQKLPIPLEHFPDYNFIGLIIGPRGTTHKRIEKETGARIAIRGRGSVRGAESQTEELHVMITADDPDSLQRGVDAIEALLDPFEET